MRIVIIAMLAVAASVPPANSARAQTPATPASDSSAEYTAATPSDTVTLASASVPRDSLRDTVLSRPRLPRKVNTHVVASSVYDSNIERDERNVGSYGFIAGAGARYQSREIRPAVQLAYEIARHAYTTGDEWDRISQDFNVVLARRLSREFLLETIGEVALKGSSEDRDIGNQYIFLPRLNYRLSSTRRLRLYGAYRIRRYDEGTDRNAANRYAGLEFRKILPSSATWETGYRYETNSAKAERRSYTRRTYFTAWTIPAGSRDQILAELEYRSQRYDKRPVKVGTTNAPRLDHRLQPSVEWIHPIGRNVALDVGYEFEYRKSNDPSKGYRDHLVTVTTRYQF